MGGWGWGVREGRVFALGRGGKVVIAVPVLFLVMRNWCVGTLFSVRLPFLLRIALFPRWLSSNLGLLARKKTHIVLWPPV